MSRSVSLTYYSDVLCVWAYIAQTRIEEVAEQFGSEVTIDYRFCSVFGDSAHKIGHGWADRGGYDGFSSHLREAVASFDRVALHPEIWQRDRPASSTPAHLVLKAVQRADPAHFEATLKAMRSAFFERCLDIGRRSVLDAALTEAGVSADAVWQQLDCGAAHAALEADRRDESALRVQGSPTFILDGGRQKLYGNVGYRVIEANIKELLRSPNAGAASWC
ncbi:MAG: DsbA family protein [Myxococcales bacterium]|nr:DsbA family protein [Myxococcales bacterium]